MRSHFHLDPDAEITVECAPGQLADETLAALAASGVNRVSLGVQSFIDREAASSGRLHSRAVVLHDIQRLRAAGTQFEIEPCVRFRGEVGEQATFFLFDPSGNALEFKSFQDPTQLFAR